MNTAVAGPSEMRDMFEAFRNECIWLRNCYNTYATLYESGERTEAALRTAAAHFFNDLNMILIDYVLLQVCRITDPAQTRGRDNLTVEQVNSRLQIAGLLTDAIARRSKGLIAYRELVKDARNKLVSHADLESVIRDLPLGAHAQERVDAFFEDMQEYCDEVGRAIGAGPLDFRTQPGRGDVLDLIRVLREATGDRASRVWQGN
jgi:hypothetical protein